MFDFRIGKYEFLGQSVVFTALVKFKMLTYEIVIPLTKDIPKGHHCYLRPEGAPKSLWEGEWLEPSGTVFE